MARHEGKIAIVTGGATGIGAAIARKLVSEGAGVCIIDRNEAGGLAIQQELGDRALFVEADVANSTAVEAFVNRALGHFGKLDFLVNNVASGVSGKVTEVSEEDWIRATDLTLFSVVRACRHTIPHLTRGSGAIVNIASTAGLAGQYNMGCYGSTKAGVIGLTKSLALDHVADGIRVNAVLPGLVETSATSRIQDIPDLWSAYVERIPMRRAGKASEIANAVSFLLSDEASYITGTTLVVDGGNTAWTGQPVTANYLPRKEA
jgi:meso-butanediol dehydrogenase/(S,S)-butanediol dehydrogenase/diacetyl reductase